ncbi:MAG: hypothetical protein MZV70_50155 [Desulfobacterales bacterium]|nr:hypothetical protein [Desulfobacterales bacterium]
MEQRRDGRGRSRPHAGLSRDFIRRLDASVYFDVVAHLPDDGRADGAARPRPGDARHRHPARLDRRPQGRTATAPLQVLIDGSDPNIAGIARAYITAFIEQATTSSACSRLPQPPGPASRSSRRSRGASGSGSTRTWRAATSSSPASSRSSS